MKIVRGSSRTSLSKRTLMFAVRGQNVKYLFQLGVLKAERQGLPGAAERLC